MDSKTCSAYSHNKPISSFRNESNLRILKQCSTYRNKTARSKNKGLSARTPLGDLDPNKRRLLLLRPQPAIRLSSRSLRRSSLLKRRRSQGLILEKQGSLRRKFRKRDKTIVYKDFLSSYGSLPIICLLLAYILTPVLPNRTVLLPFILRP